jgi:hypothetical protein
VNEDIPIKARKRKADEKGQALDIRSKERAQIGG